MYVGRTAGAEASIKKSHMFLQICDTFYQHRLDYNYSKLHPTGVTLLRPSVFRICSCMCAPQRLCQGWGEAGFREAEFVHELNQGGQPAFSRRVGLKA